MPGCLWLPVPLDTERLIAICRDHDVAMVGIFGLMARVEATAQSDMDLLLSFGHRRSLLALVRLERELASAPGRKVDRHAESAISPGLHERILRAVDWLLAQQIDFPLAL